MLNPESPIPLYHQLADLLMAEIDSGQYKKGDMLPSEIRIAKGYGIGRPTVRQAMSVLLKKGLIERKRGAGTFVKERSRQVDLFSLSGTSQAFSEKGIETISKLITPVTLLEKVDDPDNPFDGNKAYYLSRLTLLITTKKDGNENLSYFNKKGNGKEKGEHKITAAMASKDIPILLEKIYLHHTLFSGLEKIDLHDRSLAQVISDQFYMKPTAGHQTFKVSLLSSDHASLLDLPIQSPILEVTRTLDFPNSAAAIFSRLYCRTDRFAFSQTIQMDTSE